MKKPAVRGRQVSTLQPRAAISSANPWRHVVFPNPVPLIVNPQPFLAGPPRAVRSHLERLDPRRAAWMRLAVAPANELHTDAAGRPVALSAVVFSGGGGWWGGGGGGWGDFYTGFAWTRQTNGRADFRSVLGVFSSLSCNLLPRNSYLFPVSPLDAHRASCCLLGENSARQIVPWTGTAGPKLRPWFKGLVVASFLGFQYVFWPIDGAANGNAPPLLPAGSFWCPFSSTNFVSGCEAAAPLCTMALGQCPPSPASFQTAVAR